MCEVIVNSVVTCVAFAIGTNKLLCFSSLARWERYRITKRSLRTSSQTKVWLWKYFSTLMKTTKVPFGVTDEEIRRHIMMCYFSESILTTWPIVMTPRATIPKFSPWKKSTSQRLIWSSKHCFSSILLSSLTVFSASSAYHVQGWQCVAKFKESVRNKVEIHLGIFRLPDHETDIIVSFNNSLLIR